MFNKSRCNQGFRKLGPFLCQLNQPLSTIAALKNVKTEKREG